MNYINSVQHHVVQLCTKAVKEARELLQSSRTRARLAGYLQLVISSSQFLVLLVWNLVGFAWTQVLLEGFNEVDISKVHSLSSMYEGIISCAPHVTYFPILAYIIRAMLLATLAGICLQIWAALLLLKATENDTTPILSYQSTRIWRVITAFMMITESLVSLHLLNLIGYGVISIAIRILFMWMANDFNLDQNVSL